jgi:hypothetical protein
MGSFNGAGIAERGGGYVESCWVKTDATEAVEGTKPHPVFGAPSDTKGYQVVNSYYYDGNKDIYTTNTGDAEIEYENHSKGVVTRKSAQAFYNGELAYDLNNFYLYKRYSDKQKLSSGVPYDYFTIDEDNKPELHMNQYYAENTNAKYCSSGTGSGTTYTKYVENRFADGDYRYAAGEIPETDDERHWIEVIKEEGKPDKEEDRFSPIYPDDYIFFGQRLNFGYAAEAHQDVPTAVVREGGRLAQSELANRVFRAPAYFRNDTMRVVHFNPNVYLAQRKITQKNGKAKPEYADSLAYPGMTAIDFAGHYEAYTAYGTYGLGDATGLFYTPVLDDDGLLSIQNCDETRNLLVYAPAASGKSGYVNAKTHGVLTNYFVGTESVKREPVYNDYYDNSNEYRIVEEAPTSTIYGHLVQSDLTATNDHLLVDKEDFNCPIEYTFTNAKRMWYQRTPGDKEYVDRTKGWQGISLPFTAELVTTHQKGEITHFYSGSKTSANSDEKIGHEYWLRNLTSLKKVDGEKEGDFTVEGDFKYPEASGEKKTVTNKFLWEYYYENSAVHNQKDKNGDEYQEYYSSSREYENYPLLTKATPYLLGLPGNTYYEFDLSGNFTAQNTAKDITKLDKQVVTFASKPNITISVSDTELKDVLPTTVSGHKYAYRPSYMNETFAAGSNAYKMNDNGDAYDKVSTSEATTIEAFRPYFVVTSVPSEARPVTRSIIFGNSGAEAEMPHERQNANDPGTLSISSKKKLIVVSSSLKYTVKVNVVNTSGIVLNSFDIKPGETIETRVNLAGVYIVQVSDSKYTKKLAVK